MRITNSAFVAFKIEIESFYCTFREKYSDSNYKDRQIGFICRINPRLSNE